MLLAPTVYAYGLDGTLRWSAELPGFDGGTAFDLDDGTLRDLPPSLPRLDVADGSRVFSHANDPYPKVRVFELPRD